MAELVNSCMTDMRLHEIARDITGYFYAGTPAEYVSALRLWVMSKVTVVDEPDEMLIRPTLLLERLLFYNGRAYGDCDDLSMLIAAMAKSLGIAVRFRAVNPLADGSFTHVFPECFVSNAWIPVDATVRNFPGWAGDSLTVGV